MWHYDAPLRDMQFVIERVLDAPGSWSRNPSLSDCDLDTARQVLEEAARYASEVLAPTNGVGDLRVAACARTAASKRLPVIAMHTAPSSRVAGPR